MFIVLFIIAINAPQLQSINCPRRFEIHLRVPQELCQTGAQSGHPVMRTAKRKK